MPERHQPIEPICFIPETFITPIVCPYCGAHAHLMRRSPHPKLKAEIRTFECIDCKQQTAMTVND